MKNQGIKAIMFDYGGVITKGDVPGEISGMLEREYSLQAGTVFPAFRKFYKEAKVGKMNDALFWRAFLEEADIPFSEKEKVKNKFLEMPAGQVKKEMLDYVMKLKKNYFTMMLTNNIEFWFEHDREKLNLDNYFDDIFTSYEIGMKKPDLESYNFVIKHFGFEPKEYIFTDDHLVNVLAAREAGMNAYQFKGLEQLKTDFGTLGVKTE